jgi:hypothetical protein
MDGDTVFPSPLRSVTDCRTDTYRRSADGARVDLEARPALFISHCPDYSAPLLRGLGPGLLATRFRCC